MRHPIRSLRRLLLREVTWVLALIWLAASGFILARTWNEVQDAYLDQVKQVSHVLVSVLDGGSATLATVQDSLPRFRDRNYFVIIRSGGDVVIRTASALEYERSPQDWYVKRDVSDSGLIEATVGLRREEPMQLILTLGVGAAAPLLLGLVATLGMIWLALGRGLRPLDDLGAELAARRPDALTPLPDETVPHELRPVVAALNDLLARLDVALSKERRFVADASHELRTPLTAIRAQLDTIDQSQLDPSAQQALARVSTGTDRASRLVGQLLALARADAGALVEAAPVDTVMVLSELAAELYPQAVKTGKELELNLTPAHLPIRREDLEMMIGNLLENAIYHSSSIVRLSSSLQPDSLRIIVEDDGPGVPRAERAAIFERFRRGTNRADQTTRGLARGAGLGLSIVASVANRIGARMDLSDADPNGLCVTLHIPAASGRPK